MSPMPTPQCEQYLQDLERRHRRGEVSREGQDPRRSRDAGGPAGRFASDPEPDPQLLGRDQRKPIMLDLFCGAGGAAMGYHRAGFDVIGVDVSPQPSYPFSFIEDDAFRILRALYEDDEALYLPFPDTVTPDGQLVGVYSLRQIAAIHASPPCQAYGAATHTLVTRDAPRFIEPIREVLQTIGKPYVIENVVGAPLDNPVVLCGSMFGLDVKRHRLFETSWPMMAPPCNHGAWLNRYPTHARKDKAQFSPVVHIYGTGGGAGKNIDLWRRVMEVEWMQSKAEIAESIPPAYTEFIGASLMAELELEVTA